MSVQGMVSLQTIQHMIIHVCMYRLIHSLSIPTTLHKSRSMRMRYNDTTGEYMYSYNTIIITITLDSRTVHQSISTSHILSGNTSTQIQCRTYSNVSDHDQHGPHEEHAPVVRLYSADHALHYLLLEFLYIYTVHAAYTY